MNSDPRSRTYWDPPAPPRFQTATKCMGSFTNSVYSGFIRKAWARELNLGIHFVVEIALLKNKTESIILLRVNLHVFAWFCPKLHNFWSAVIRQLSKVCPWGIQPNPDLAISGCSIKTSQRPHDTGCFVWRDGGGQETHPTVMEVHYSAHLFLTG